MQNKNIGQVRRLLQKSEHCTNGSWDVGELRKLT